MLNDMICRTAKPKPNRYKLTDNKGLFLEVLPTGSKFWRIRYRIHGKEKLFTIGEYPLVSLQKAREEKIHIISLVKSGTDPILKRINEKLDAKIKANTTFKQVALEWYDINKPQWETRYATTVLYRFEKYAFDDLGDLPISEMKSSHVLACLKKIEVKGPEMARRIRQLISHVFLYAEATDRAEKDITASLKHALKKYKKGRYKSIDLELLPKFVYDICENKAQLNPQTYLAIRFMMLTFVRTSEMLDAKWSEFDFETNLWIIPAERMKMKQAHIVPLSKQAIEILMELKQFTGKREHVFASIPRPRKPMCNGTVLVALKRLGYNGVMTGHGFRALALGILKEKLRYTHEVADRQLAHAPRNSVDRAYDRAKFLDDRIIMMQKYADYLDKVLEAERIRSSPALEATIPKPSNNLYQCLPNVGYIMTSRI